MLAHDAGAGKAIMAVLVIKELKRWLVRVKDVASHAETHQIEIDS